MKKCVNFDDTRFFLSKDFFVKTKKKRELQVKGDNFV